MNFDWNFYKTIDRYINEEMGNNLGKIYYNLNEDEEISEEEEKYIRKNYRCENELYTDMDDKYITILNEKKMSSMRINK